MVVGGWGKRAVGTAPDNGINAICVCFTLCVHSRESVCLCGVRLCVWTAYLPHRHCLLGL